MILQDKKILAIEPYLPCPILSGGQLRIYQTLSELKTYYNIDCFCFHEKEQSKKESSAFFKKNRIRYKYFPQSSRNLLLFITKHVPFWLSSWFSNDAINQISQSKTQNILIETAQLLYLTDYIKKDTHIVYVAQDIATVSFLRRLREKNLFKIILFFPLLLQVYLYERHFLPKANVVIAMSANDKKILERYFNCQNVSVVPNGISKNILNLKQQPKKIIIGYIGRSEHTPNISAVDFLLNKLSPFLKKLNIKHKIFILGTGYKINTTNSNIIYKSYLPNLNEFYNNITCLAVPLSSGSGSRIKILEALGYGKPVITTKIGAEGIKIKNEMLTILKEPNNLNEWKNKIVNSPNIKILQKKRLKEELSNYSWNKIFRSNYQLFSSVTKESSG